ncbi:hypothetical protein NLI96_g4674 [Meripilus lineatus]|uniref:Uncharacterized protein n=1 Tax=Meripilus lineatus TaxID=2056292 RepID=A0AAD5V6D7_9APHY|nr:hypothetical protein NLI96_g4674 [Physisporinus lineatus]
MTFTTFTTLNDLSRPLTTLTTSHDFYDLLRLLRPLRATLSKDPSPIFTSQSRHIHTPRFTATVCQFAHSLPSLSTQPAPYPTSSPDIGSTRLDGHLACAVLSTPQHIWKLETVQDLSVDNLLNPG